MNSTQPQPLTPEEEASVRLRADVAGKTLTRIWATLDASRAARTADPGGLREAADDIASGPWIVSDGETGDEWCYFCDQTPDYKRGKAVERHHASCTLVALRRALASETTAPDPGHG